MNKKYRIGIDIGGTHTDAVMVDASQHIITSCKIPTTLPLEIGVRKAICSLLEQSRMPTSDIQAIYIGTTHATNAILEAKDLYKVGVLRLAGQRPMSLDPCFKWPEYIRRALFAGYETVAGGFRCDMREISPLSETEIRSALGRLQQKGMQSLAIAGVFSPACAQHEIEALSIAKDCLGNHFPITISSSIGGMGFVERENAAILNAALKKTMLAAFENMESLKHGLAIDAPLYVTQNDGSMIDLSQAMEKPLLTISSGPTNSFIGAAKLAGLQDAIIVDVGGTSADIGVVLNGYPRRSLGQASLGGIPLNFRMPDVLSLPIGGGSVVRIDKDGCRCGPDSIGRKLYDESCLFGGNTLTLTDVAYMSGLISIPLANTPSIPIDLQQAQHIMRSVLTQIQTAIGLMRGRHTQLPVLAVGGGAYFLKDIAHAVPEHYSVANAYGASLAEISYTLDTVVSLEYRDAVLNRLQEEASTGAVLKGAKEERVRIVDVQVIPYHYIPNQMGRVIVTASG